VKRLIILLMLAAATASSWAQAPGDPDHLPQSVTPAPAPPTGQPGMGKMGNTPMMGGMRNMMGPGMAALDHIEGRIAFLRAELNITEAQTSAWNAFADALRTNAKKLAQVRGSMMPQPSAGQQQVPTIAERFDMQEQWLLARLDGVRALKSAFTSLYGTLLEDQKKTANELLLPHMEMGMMTMMPGLMQPVQMQPGAR
jgi:hypothetical protein